MCLGPCVRPGEGKVTFDAWWVGAVGPGERRDSSELVHLLEEDLKDVGSKGHGSLEAGFLSMPGRSGESGRLVKQVSGTCFE